MVIEIWQIMSEIWDRVFHSDNTFFGDEQSGFAILCLNHMKPNNVKRVLEIGAGHGRDTMFFAVNGLEVEALTTPVKALR